MNAFFVGVYNGIINFIAGLLSGDSQELIEAISQEFEKLKEAGFFSYVFSELGKFFDKVANRYDTAQSKYVIVKNLGEDIFAIFETIIGAIYVYKVGATIARGIAGGAQALKKRIDDLLDTNRGKLGDIARSNRRYTDKVTRKRFDDDLISEQVKEFELSIKDEKIENGRLFSDDDGSSILDKIIGTSVSIELSKLTVLKARREMRRLGKRIDDLVFTHNHPPPGTSLSFEDIGLAIKHNLKIIRAVNFDGTIFELKRIGRYPDEPSFVRDMKRIFKARYPNLKRGTLEFQLKQAELAIEILGDAVEYTHYVN